MKKIGFLVLAHPDYVADGLAASFAETAEKQLRDLGCEVVRPAAFLCDHRAAREAALALLSADVAGCVLFLASWVECPTVMAALAEVRHLPQCMWGFPMKQTPTGEQSTGSYVSYAMLQGSLNRIGQPFTPILAEPGTKEAGDALAAFTSAADTCQRLRRSRIGLIGYSSMTIYPGTFDHLLLRSMIGPEVIHSDSYSLIRRAEKQPKEKTDAILGELASKARIDADVPSEQLSRAAALCAALREMKTEEDLSAVNAKCQYEFSKEYGMTLCVPLSLAATPDFVTSCEGDILCTVSMLILQYITGQTIGYGDAITAAGNRVKLSPCGFMPYGLCSEAGCRVCNFMPGVGFSGIQNCCVMKPGKITALRLVEDVGSYHLVVFRGTGRADTKPRQGYMPALDIDLEAPVSELEKLYAGQHFALCYGDVTETLRSLASMLHIDVTVIG